MNAAQNATNAADGNAPPATLPNEKPDTAPSAQEKYNPMAQIIERHENAVNRLKHGK